MVKFELLNENAKYPASAYGDAGYDLFIPYEWWIEAGINRVPLGISSAFSPSLVCFIKDRSSVALKGLYTVAGVIDSSYRGEWAILFQANGTYKFNKHERIAQAVFLPIFKDADYDQDRGIRGQGGFGSTGV